MVVKFSDKSSMSWIPLRDRLNSLPLILAGPILRRTEPDTVTVWVALKSPSPVTLSVYATDAQGATIAQLLLTGSHDTVPLGQHLHLVAVTAQPINPAQTLKSGQIYAYDLSFGSHKANLIAAITSDTIPAAPISYFDHQLPTFALPPDDLNQLRLAHGSCRKLHGGGQDALPILDDLIAYNATQPNSRLHQLFLTGDQIYGDEVADPFLWTLIDAGDTLLGWEEKLPFTDKEYKKPRELKPGQRTNIAKDYGGFTAMLLNTPEQAKSHLFSLGEYCAIYLFAWSPVLWQEEFPQPPPEAEPKQWAKETRVLQDLTENLWKVRRALANVSTYMVFDDHDISDDWYLNRWWCVSVLGKLLGRRAVQNGLLAYSLFQGWGNTPAQFQQGKTGEKLLKAVATWSASAGTNQSASEEIAKCIGLPDADPKTGYPRMKLDENVLVLDRDYPDGTLPLEWHYTIRSDKHEVIVLDSRTWRGYPQGEDGTAPPMLLSPTAFIQQVQKPLERTDRVRNDIEATLVVVPTNLVSLRIIDIVQQWELSQGNVFSSDVGDAWNFHEAAFSRLLAEFFKERQRVVVLSGDIHYGAAVRLSYWSKCLSAPAKLALDTKFLSFKCEDFSTQNSTQTGLHDTSSPQDLSENPTPNQPNLKAHVLAQLTASAFKNAEFKTYFIHTRAKSIAPEPPQDWAGWKDPPQLVEIQVIQETVRKLDVAVPKEGPVVRQLHGARGYWNIAWETVVKNERSLPDWRYHIEWIKHEKAVVAPWIGTPIAPKLSKNTTSTGWLNGLENTVSLLWRNQWVQEGQEVVGHNNLGLISFQWSPHEQGSKAVIQDSYWRPPWRRSSVVYSRYFVSLDLDEAPPPLPIVPF